MNKNIAVVILNYIQYVNIIPGVDILIRKGYNVDIYCPKIETNDGFDDMYNDNIKLMKSNGYNVYTKVTSKKYKILLEPYPYLSINSTYKIRYRYSNISAKPNIAYKPENYLWYDAILCSGKYEANLLSVFSKTYLTGNMLFHGFKKNNQRVNNKKNLIYLPTYGEESSIDTVSDELEKLKEKYYIITKIHHGTTFLKNERNRIKKIESISDEFYDCKYSLTSLLSIADVILTDNSGSIFDGLYAKVPVAVFCQNINYNKLMNFDTTQFTLYSNGILPYTNKASQVNKILDDAQSSNIVKKQNCWANNNFYYTKNEVNEFANIIISFLNDDVDEDYFHMHEIIREKYIYCLNESKRIVEVEEEKNKLKMDLNFINESFNKQIDENETLKNEIQKLNFINNDYIKENDILKKDNERLNNINSNYLDELNNYRKGKLYKICNKIYSLKGKLLCKKK